MQITNQKINEIFPTPLMTCTVEGDEELEYYAQLIEEIAKTDPHPQSTRFCKQTYDDLDQRPEFKPLVDLIYREFQSVFNTLELSRTGHYVNGLWGNVSYDGHTHMAHPHPNNYFSGILYLKTPPGSGSTIFLDPRPGAMVYRIDPSATNKINGDTITTDAVAGKMLLFPSWLYHSVTENSFSNPTDKRISIAFNIQFEGMISRQHTARWNLRSIKPIGNLPPLPETGRK